MARSLHHQARSGIFTDVGTLISPMTSQAVCSPLNLEQTIQHIFASRKITRHDQQLLMSLFFKKGLTAQEESWISQLHNALHQGLLRVVD